MKISNLVTLIGLGILVTGAGIAGAAREWPGVLIAGTLTCGLGFLMARNGG